MTDTEKKTAFDMKAYMKEYNKTYYATHKQHIMKLVADRKKLVKGSDLYRERLVEELNSWEEEVRKRTNKSQIRSETRSEDFEVVLILFIFVSCCNPSRN